METSGDSEVHNFISEQKSYCKNKKVDAFMPENVFV